MALFKIKTHAVNNLIHAALLSSRRHRDRVNILDIRNDILGNGNNTSHTWAFVCPCGDYSADLCVRPRGSCSYLKKVLGNTKNYFLTLLCR